ncbi:hypothetical protein PCE1_004107 [Barthelona sp. PCE]
MSRRHKGSSAAFLSDSQRRQWGSKQRNVELDTSVIVTQVHDVNHRRENRIAMNPNILLPERRTEGFTTRMFRFFGSIFCCSSSNQTERLLETHSDPLLTSRHLLLPPQSEKYVNKKTLVLDLDETLIHSTFMPTPNTRSDYALPVVIDGTTFMAYVGKRPYVDEFIMKVTEMFEVVIFTASISKYADPLIDLIDYNEKIPFRLFRDSCSFINSNYVKDLSLLGRKLKNVIILDNSSVSYMLHRSNAIGIDTWKTDMSDCELLNIIPVLEKLSTCEDVRPEITKLIASSIIYH